MTRRPWSATSTPCGTPATSKTSASSANRLPKAGAFIVYVKERPTIREINYTGLSSVSNSDVLDRFKERKVGLSVESQYDPTRIKKAEVTIKKLLSEHGRQFATDPHRSATDSSGRGGHHVRGEGRPEGQSRQDHIRGQQEHQESRFCAPR